jgi:hypothetical protein
MPVAEALVKGQFLSPEIAFCKNYQPPCQFIVAITLILRRLTTVAVGTVEKKRG